MTTGRINQVCQMLPRTVQPHATTWHGTAPAAKKYPRLFTTHKHSAWTKQTLPSKRNLPLDTSQPHLEQPLRQCPSASRQLAHEAHAQSSSHSTHEVSVTTMKLRWHHPKEEQVPRTIRGRNPGPQLRTTAGRQGTTTKLARRHRHSSTKAPTGQPRAPPPPIYTGRVVKFAPPRTSKFDFRISIFEFRFDFRFSEALTIDFARKLLSPVAKIGRWASKIEFRIRKIEFSNLTP